MSKQRHGSYGKRPASGSMWWSLTSAPWRRCELACRDARRCCRRVDPRVAGSAASCATPGRSSTGRCPTAPDGYEETFAGNCLGHFLLVKLMLDSVAQDGRIVWTSSGTHDPASMDGKSVGAAVEPDARALVRQGRNGKPISGGRRYATSKLCVILYAYELDRRLRRTGDRISSIAYDPAFCPTLAWAEGRRPSSGTPPSSSF